MQLKPHITHNKLLYLLRIFTHLCIISLWWIKFCPSKCPFLSAFQHEAHKSLLTPPWMTYNLRQLEVLEEPLWQLGTGTNVKFTIYVYIFISIYIHTAILYTNVSCPIWNHTVYVYDTISKRTIDVPNQICICIQQTITCRNHWSSWNCIKSKISKKTPGGGDWRTGSIWNVKHLVFRCGLFLAHF